MHDNDIIHLDIKPNNIVCVSRWERKSIEEKQHTNVTYVGGLEINYREIITFFRAESNLQVKIIDFGLAKDLQVMSTDGDRGKYELE